MPYSLWDWLGHDAEKIHFFCGMIRPQPWIPEKGLDKITKYCVFQDRCQWEVETKLHQLGCPPEDVDGLIDQLIDERYLDERRFAVAFARGKFSMKGWGRIRIQAELRAKRVSEDLIAEALEGLDPEAYASKLEELARKKLGDGDTKDWEAMQKLKLWLGGKGYEWDLIDEVLGELEEGNLNR
jgi:regulatory protein